MPQYIAERSFRMAGTDYALGDPIEPQDFASLTPDKRRRLIEHRFVSADRVVVDDGADSLVQVVQRDGQQWHDVFVNGDKVNDKGMTQEDADALADEYRADLGLSVNAAA